MRPNPSKSVEFCRQRRLICRQRRRICCQRRRVCRQRRRICRVRRVRRIWMDFDAFLRRNGKRARRARTNKKIKIKTDVSLYFLLRVCVSSSNKTC